MLKSFDKSNLRGKGLFWFIDQGEPIGVGKTRQQDPEAAGHTESAVRKQV